MSITYANLLNLFGFNGYLSKTGKHHTDGSTDAELR